MWKLLRYDIHAGFYLNRWKWISVIFIFSIITILYSRLNPHVTSSDFIYTFFKGAIKTDYNIEIPYMFLLLQIYCMFLVGHFVYDDYMTFGIYVITKAGTKTKWLFSKICWMFFNITLFYILIFLIFISITGFKIEWGIFTNLNISPFNAILSIMLLLYSTSLFMGLAHVTLSFILKPIYSYIIISVLYILSIFSDSVYIPGAQAMLTRYSPFTVIPIYQSYVFSFLLFVFSSFVLFKIIYVKDIIREHE